MSKPLLAPHEPCFYCGEHGRLKGVWSNPKVGTRYFCHDNDRSCYELLSGHYGDTPEQIEEFKRNRWLPPRAWDVEGFFAHQSGTIITKKELGQ